MTGRVTDVMGARHGRVTGGTPRPGRVTDVMGARHGPPERSR